MDGAGQARQRVGDGVNDILAEDLNLPLSQRFRAFDTICSATQDEAVEGATVTPYEELMPVSLPASIVEDPVLVLPIGTYIDNLALVSSTDAFPRMPNGATSTVPYRQTALALSTRDFPDAPSVDYLRKLGIRTVVVIEGEPDLNGNVIDVTKPIDGLGITRTSFVDGPYAETIFHL